MRISVKYAIWLLPLMPLVQGCTHRAQPTQSQPLAPPIVDKPLPKPATVSTADLPPPVLGDTTQPKQAKAEPPPPTPQPEKKPAKRSHKTVPATPPAPQDAANPPSSVSAIGQLSGGDSGDLRAQTEDTISQTEKGLNAVTRTLSESETRTAAQIREFLKQARQALTTGDTDGAHTLAMKAKVLLTELNPK